MKKLFPLFLLVLICSIESFSQETQIENRPPPYLLSAGESRSGSARTRIYQAEQQPKSSGLPKKINVFELERRAFDLINECRAKSGLKALEWSDDAARLARLHSENMANYNFFSHTGRDGLIVSERADLLGIRKWQAIGENIAYNQGFENPVEFTVERWMQSPKHRDNLLNARWLESGIGIAVTENATYYFTEVFLVR